MQNLVRRLSFNFWYYRQPPWDTGISPPELLEFIESHPPGRAIDLGCGTGTNIVTLARAGWKVTGVDFAPHAIKLARRKLKQAGIQADVKIKDVTRLGGIYGPYDLAFDLGCFHGIAQNRRNQYLEQLNRILAPGGYWLMYGSIRSETGHASHGLTEAELTDLSARLNLLSRRDGIDTNQHWSSAWFLFQKKNTSGRLGNCMIAAQNTHVTIPLKEKNMNTEADRNGTIAESLLFDLTRAFALPQTKFTKSVIRLLVGRLARTAAEAAMEVDRTVAEGGPAAGARRSLPRFVKSYEARGTENIPPSGPLIIASNHPAFIDSFVITAHVDRPDYKAIIGDIPFLENMPHIREHAIFAPDEGNTMGRMRVIRESIRHLKSGGSLLIFPLGSIEADPEFMQDPDGDFHRWSHSLEIFMQRVPNLQILVTMVSGVISPAAMRHPITWFRKSRPDKQRLAFIYQLARQILSGRQIFDLTPRVTFGEILTGNHHKHVLAEVEQAACRTLEEHMSWKYV